MAVAVAPPRPADIVFQCGGTHGRLDDRLDRCGAREGVARPRLVWSTVPVTLKTGLSEAAAAASARAAIRAARAEGSTASGSVSAPAPIARRTSSTSSRAASTTRIRPLRSTASRRAGVSSSRSTEGIEDRDNDLSFGMVRDIKVFLDRPRSQPAVWGGPLTPTLSRGRGLLARSSLPFSLPLAGGRGRAGRRKRVIPWLQRSGNPGPPSGRAAPVSRTGPAANPRQRAGAAGDARAPRAARTARTGERLRPPGTRKIVPYQDNVSRET